MGADLPKKVRCLLLHLRSPASLLRGGTLLRARGKQPQPEPRSSQARDSSIDRRGFGKYPGNGRPAPLQARIRLMESSYYGSKTTISPSLKRGPPRNSRELGAVQAASPHRRLFCSVLVHLVNSLLLCTICLLIWSDSKLIDLDFWGAHFLSVQT